MIALTDSQLKAVMAAARMLPVEKRDVYLQRIAAMLTMRGRGHFSHSDVADVAALALAGLVHAGAALSQHPHLWMSHYWHRNWHRTRRDGALSSGYDSMSFSPQVLESKARRYRKGLAGRVLYGFGDRCSSH
jgi:hypothetical protein